MLWVAEPLYFVATEAAIAAAAAAAAAKKKVTIRHQEKEVEIKHQIMDMRKYVVKIKENDDHVPKKHSISYLLSIKDKCQVGLTMMLSLLHIVLHLTMLVTVRR
eukprot:4743926-Ditylum_brightwellii.AAC.1